MNADLDSFSLEEARTRWADETANFPVGPNVFLALCDAHSVRVTSRQRAAVQQCVIALYARGNTYGVQYRQEAPWPKGVPSPVRLAEALSNSLDGIVGESELRLRVSMIPKPLFGQNLRKHMPKSSWVKLRQGLIDQRGSKCEYCGAVPPSSELDAHEEWEYEPSRRPARATVVGIRLACTKCHAVIHFGLQYGLVQQGSLPVEHLDELQAHFCAVNGVGPKMFSVHLHAATERWAELNRKKAWQLDLGGFAAPAG